MCGNVNRAILNWWFSEFIRCVLCIVRPVFRIAILFFPISCRGWRTYNCRSNCKLYEQIKCQWRRRLAQKTETFKWTKNSHRRPHVHMSVCNSKKKTFRNKDRQCDAGPYATCIVKQLAGWHQTPSVILCNFFLNSVYNSFSECVRCSHYVLTAHEHSATAIF